MSKRIVAAFLILWMGLPLQAIADCSSQASQSGAEDGIQKVREADFENGSKVLEAARKKLIEQQAGVELSRVDVYLSMAYFELGKEDVARARLKEAWAWNQNLTLSSADFAPRFITFFNQVRTDVDTQNRKRGASKKWIVIVPIAFFAAAAVVYSGLKK
jgi:hypothetical protein